MDIKFIALEEQSLRGLRFAGKNEDRNIVEGFGKNQVIKHRFFKLLSPDFPGGADVFIPADVAKSGFEFKQKVRLINPRVIAKGVKTVNNNAFVDWELYADDIVAVN